MQHKNHVATSSVLITIGYAIKLFCFGYVAWLALVCFDKYLGQPISTSVSFMPNTGIHPAAITFCKSLSYSNMSANMSLNREPMDDLLLIEVELEGQQNWSRIYENGTFGDLVPLHRREFTSFSWSANTFKLCFSLQLGNDEVKINQLRITYRWHQDQLVYNEPKYNLQALVHGWGSFALMKSEIPLKESFQVFQLIQESVVSLSTDASKCSDDESVMLDQCLETKAAQFASRKIGCLSDMLR
jgi:hypothetical protein